MIFRDSNIIQELCPPSYCLLLRHGCSKIIHFSKFNFYAAAGAALKLSSTHWAFRLNLIWNSLEEQWRHKSLDKTAETWGINSTVQKTNNNERKSTNGDYYFWGRGTLSPLAATPLWAHFVLKASFTNISVTTPFLWNIKITNSTALT